MSTDRRNYSSTTDPNVPHLELIDRLAAENAELRKALQDFEADDACEQRCQRLESENAELRARVPADGWVAELRSGLSRIEDGIAFGDMEAMEVFSRIRSLLAPVLNARPNPSAHPARSPVETTDGR